MKKEVIFEQISQTHCHVNLKKVAGLVSEIQWKIKNHKGTWDQDHHKFEVPLTSLPSLIKEIKEMTAERSQIHIESIPPRIGRIVESYKEKGKLTSKQILIDSCFGHRYEYVNKKVLQEYYQKFKEKNNFQKWLLFCQEQKVDHWISVLSQYNCSELLFKEKEFESIKKENKMWVCSYDKLLEKHTQLYKYCFQNVICDDAQYLQEKLNEDEEKNFSIRGYLSQKHAFFPIFSKTHLNNFQLLYCFLSLIKAKEDFSWMKKRYRKQNLNELYFILSKCRFIKKIDAEESEENEESCEDVKNRNYFNNIILKTKQHCLERIKSINSKYSNINHKKVLECAGRVKVKNEKSYFDSIVQIFFRQKQANILWFLNYYCKVVKTKIAVVMETPHAYKIFQNYCYEKQIPYCHYEQPSSIIDFNTNPSILVCLIKMQNLLQIDPSKHKYEVLQNHGRDLGDYNPEQYQCLSCVNNIFFPDPEWVNDINARQLALKQCFHYFKGDIIRHYFLLKGTYEEKWMQLLQQQIIKFELHYMNTEEESSDDEEENKAFAQILVASAKEKYDSYNYATGVKDIDEQYDNLQYQALKQKQERVERKKKKKQLREKLQKQRAQKLRQQKQQQREELQEKHKMKKDHERYSYLFDRSKARSQTRQIIQVSSSPSPVKNSKDTNQQENNFCILLVPKKKVRFT